MDTRTKVAIGISVVVALAIAALLYVTLSTKPSKVPEVVTSKSPTPVATPSSSATPSSGEILVYDETIQESTTKNPVLNYVPKVTPFWIVEFTGSRTEGKLNLDVTIFIRPKEDRDAVIKTQRKFIGEWLTSIGQPEDSYALTIKTERIDSF